jgi:beta-lactamase regulating signal transducer with metallopeptidase domain
MTSHFDGLAHLAWAQLWQVTIVALGVGAIVRICCRDRPRLAYALWMLVVVKAIVPPYLSSPTGVFSWALARPAATQPVFAENRANSIVASRPVATSSRDGITNDFSDDRAFVWQRLRLVLIPLWAAGVVLCGLFVLVKQILCSALIRRSSLPLDERYLAAVANHSRRLGLKRRVRLIVTSRPIGPAVFGVVYPTILMPDSLLSGNHPEQLELVLAHELIHVRRGDIIAGKLQLIAQLVWWFHPLIWWVNREACRERERCCDAEVVSGVGCKPAIYARALLNVIEQKSRLRPLVAIPGVRAQEVTSRRLEWIMRYANADHRRASLMSRLVFVTGAALLVPGAGLSLGAHPPAVATLQDPAKVSPPKLTDAAPTQNSPQAKDKKATEPQDARARWRAQRVVRLKAEAEYRNAGLHREVAEIAVIDYEEGVFNQDLAAVAGEIKLAESDRKRSEDRLEWARRMFSKGYVAKSVVVAEEQALRKARFAIEQAQSKKKVLVDYTKGKTIKELKSEVEKARSDELAKKKVWELEKAKESALEREVNPQRPTSGTTQPN